MKRNTVSPSQEQPPTTNVTCLACMGRHRRHSCELQGIRGRPRKHDRRRRINKKNGTKVKACRVQPLRNRKITCQSSNALTRKASAVAATRVAVVSPTHEVNTADHVICHELRASASSAGAAAVTGAEETKWLGNEQCSTDDELFDIYLDNSNKGEQRRRLRLVGRGLHCQRSRASAQYLVQ